GPRPGGTPAGGPAPAARLILIRDRLEAVERLPQVVGDAVEARCAGAAGEQIILTADLHRAEQELAVGLAEPQLERLVLRLAVFHVLGLRLGRRRLGGRIVERLDQVRLAK